MSQTIEVNADALNELLSQVDSGGFVGWMPKLGIAWTNSGFVRLANPTLQMQGGVSQVASPPCGESA
jgi:hypothetical protein